MISLYIFLIQKLQAVVMDENIMFRIQCYIIPQIIQQSINVNLAEYHNSSLLNQNVGFYLFFVALSSYI